MSVYMSAQGSRMLRIVKRRLSLIFWDVASIVLSFQSSLHRQLPEPAHSWSTQRWSQPVRKHLRLATNQQVQFRLSEREDSLSKGQFSRLSLATAWAGSLTSSKHTQFCTNFERGYWTCEKTEFDQQPGHTTLQLIWTLRWYWEYYVKKWNPMTTT